MSLNILEEWKEFQPKNIIDGRDKLPKHKTLVWKKRSISDIIGMCLHQTAGNENPINTAAYHVKYFPRSKTKKGAPGLCYTFYVRKSGEIWWCNDIEDVPWSQGYGPRPGDENKEFVSVVTGGNFSGPGYIGKEDPTPEQLNSLKEMYKWLQFHLEFNPMSLFGHSSFGKIACPGYIISNLMDEIKEENKVGNRTWSDEDWQRALVKLGYKLGKFGPNKDGVDGAWGNRSKAALVKFQQDSKITVSGYKDEITLSYLIRALDKKL